MEGEINSNKSTNPAKDVAASNAPSCKNPLRLPPPASTHPSPTFHSPLRSLFIPLYSSAYSTVLILVIIIITNSLFIQFCSSVGITHYTLVSSFSITLVGLFFTCVRARAGGRGECKIETNGDLLALLPALLCFHLFLFFSVFFLLSNNPYLS